MKDKKSAKISTLGSQLTSVISVSLVLILLGGLAIIYIGGRHAIDNVRSSMALTITVAPGLSDYDINPVRQELTRGAYCTGFSYLSADQVLEQEVQLVGDSTFMLLDGNPYSAEFQATLKPAYATSDSLAKITARLKNIPVVESVDIPVNVAADVDHSLNRITLVALSLALALLIISIVLINNTVSLSIYARRFIIHTMTLVGATRRFIRRPFVRAGAGVGLIAGLIAAALLGGAYAWLAGAEPEFVSEIDSTELCAVLVSIVIIGVIICSLTAFFAANRYLNKRYEQLFRK